MNLVDYWYPYILRLPGNRFVKFPCLVSYHPQAKFSGKIVVVNIFKEPSYARKVIIVGYGLVELEPGRGDILTESRIRERPFNWAEHLEALKTREDYRYTT